MTNVNVLLTSAGRRLGLMNCFRRDFAELGVTGGVFVVDSSLSAPAWHFADKAWQVSACTGDAYGRELLNLAERERIRIVVPTIDPELSALSLERRSFAELGVRVFVSTPETVEICADKRLTNAWLTEHHFPTVRQATPDTVLSQGREWSYPLILKPRRGSGSQRVRRVRCAEELALLSRLEPDLIAEEIAHGEEHTINVYADRSGKCLCAIPHQRLEIRAGEVSKAVTVKHAPMMELARRVTETLPGAYGPMNLQCFVSSDAITVTEINARLGGGYPLAHEAGATFTRWMLEDALDLPSTAAFAEWQDDLAMLRYDEAAFMAATRIRPPSERPTE
jgi:carbamoyl-phosphate synthase large subunit